MTAATAQSWTAETQHVTDVATLKVPVHCAGALRHGNGTMGHFDIGYGPVLDSRTSLTCFAFLELSADILSCH